MNCRWSDETLPKGNVMNNKKIPMFNQKTTPKNTNKQMGATKECKGDLPKETKKKTYVLKLSFVAWNQLDKEMGGKPKKSFNLKKASLTTNTHFKMEVVCIMYWTIDTLCI